MTIDEAIRHCEEVAEQKERDSVELIDMLDELDVDACKECAAENRQLTEWLRELKELRDKHWDECRQIAHYDDELKEAKRLLKLAVEDIYNARRGFSCAICDMPKNDIDVEKRCEVDNVKPDCKYKWKHADEAEKLLNG